MRIKTLELICTKHDTKSLAQNRADFAQPFSSCEIEKPTRQKLYKAENPEDN